VTATRFEPGYFWILNYYTNHKQEVPRKLIIPLYMFESAQRE